MKRSYVIFEFGGCTRGQIIEGNHLPRHESLKQWARCKVAEKINAAVRSISVQSVLTHEPKWRFFHMRDLDQYEVDELRAHLSRLEERTVPEQHEYFEQLMIEKPHMAINPKEPDCSVEFLSIIGTGRTLNLAASNWVANARTWLDEFEAKQVA